ncbi:MAG: pyridoxal-phosphate dependent enzyme [archaeon]
MKKPRAMNISPTEARKVAQHFQRIHGTTPIVRLEGIVRDGVTLNVFAKLENTQSVYTFKARGSEWFVYNLMKEYHGRYGRFRNNTEKPSLVTASSGNHAQGLALAANRYGLDAVVFVPTGTPEVKSKRVAELGATVRLEGDAYEDSLEAALAYKSEDPSRIFVSSYESPQIIAGQASVAVEILSKLCPYHTDYLRVASMPWEAPDVIIAGLGGGGLVSGMGAVAEEFNTITGNQLRVIGVQSEAADSMYRSIKEGRHLPSTDMQAKTSAEGINAKEASPRMVETVRRYVDQIVTVTEEDIIQGIVYVAEHDELRDKRWHTNEWSVPEVPFRKLPGDALSVHEYRRMNRIEGAAAAPIAAVLCGDSKGELDWNRIADGKTELSVYCILTGGNIPNDKWEKLIEIYGTKPIS